MTWQPKGNIDKRWRQSGNFGWYIPNGVGLGPNHWNFFSKNYHFLFLILSNPVDFITCIKNPRLFSKSSISKQIISVHFSVTNQSDKQFGNLCGSKNNHMWKQRTNRKRTRAEELGGSVELHEAKIWTWAQLGNLERGRRYIYFRKDGIIHSLSPSVKCFASI